MYDRISFQTNTIGVHARRSGHCHVGPMGMVVRQEYEQLGGTQKFDPSLIATNCACVTDTVYDLDVYHF